MALLTVEDIFGELVKSLKNLSLPETELTNEEREAVNALEEEYGDEDDEEEDSDEE